MTIDRRQANDFRQQRFGGDGGLIAFICECADSGCTRTVGLTRAEAEELRRRGDGILAPGHMPDEDAPLAAEAAADPLGDDMMGPAVAENTSASDRRFRDFA